MKWLIYSFIVINLGVFAWYYQPSTGKVTTEAIHGTRLVMLEEYKAELQHQVSAPNDAGSKHTCYTLGPFSDKTVTSRVEEKLASLGLALQMRVSRDKLRDGYWVMLPGNENKKATLQKLEKAAIKDFFVILKGEYKGAISLGLFSRPELAKRRLSVVKAKGFNPAVEKVSLPKREYWLDWPTSSGITIPEQTLSELRDTFSGIGKSERNCQ